MARRRRVAVLVDDSPGSMRACRYGANHVFDKETDVSLVTAVHATADGAPAKVLVVQKQKESIAEAALRGARNCDAVVVGTRGIGAVQNAMRRALGLGAVSNEVVHRSKVPVTVVPITTPVPEMITVRDGPRK